MMLERLTWGGGRGDEIICGTSSALSSIYTRVVYHRFNIFAFRIFGEEMAQ